MKKIKTIFLGLGILIVSNSFGQDDVAAPGVRFGVKAGINLANVVVKPDDDETSLGSLLGLTGGFFATIPGGAGVAIQPELNYSGLGSKYKGTDAKFQLNYLTLPVLVKYSLEDAGFGAYLGPQVGYLLSAKAKGNGQSQDIKDELKSIDFAGIIGVEYFLPVGVGLSARYQLGFMNIVKDPDEGESNKNNALTFTLGYRF